MLQIRDLREIGSNIFFKKRNMKNGKGERASCISPDATEIDKHLDELIELFPAANLEYGGPLLSSHFGLFLLDLIFK